jgi:nitrogen fixation/metabolism regulation signal transduction histidine kinase
MFFWVVPTLIIAVLIAHVVITTTERLDTSAVKESLRNSLAIAREYYDKMEFDSKETSVRMAAEFESERIPGEGPELDRFLERITAENRVDFAALYDLKDTMWVRIGSHPPRPPRVDATFPAGFEYELAEANRIAFTDEDVIASGMRSGDNSLFVSGFVLSPGRIGQMRQTGDDFSRYSALGLFVEKTRSRIRTGIVMLAVILVVASFVAARVVTRRTVRPLQELAAATQRVANGDLSHRVRVEPGDDRGEIGTLVSSFNVMTGNLEEAQRNLARTERIAAWREVARRLAHEIKNPLTPIQVSIHRIKKRLKGEDEDTRVIEECLDSILKEVSNLRSIAEEFSTFAKLPEPRFTELDVNEAIRSVLELYTTSLENIEVVTSYGERLPAVRADHDQIRSVFSNIIKNAIEAMPNGGVIVIITSLEGAAEPGGRRHVRVEISDSGGGIPKDVADQIFNPYFTTKSEGTGLGLALAYRIVQDHNGNIAFSTSADGTTFAIDLPRYGG